MKASWGFLAVVATAGLSLAPAFGQTFSPAPTVGPAITLTAPAAPAAPAPTPAAAPAMTAPPAPAASSGTSPQKLVAYSAATVDGPYVALTFDDGPNPETTPKLLKMLEQRGIKATFFVLGSRAVQAPAILKQMIAAGHEVGNHSWDHPQLPKIPVAAADKQVADTSAAIEQITGKAPLYLRPPYGAMTPALRSHLREKYGVTFIYWSVDPLDWKDRNSQVIADRILSHVHPGAIVLAHDIHPTTVDAMPKVLDGLKAKGYKFVTVSELIAMNKAVPEPKVALAAAGAQPKKKPRPAGATASASGASGAAKPAKPAQMKPAVPVRNTSNSGSMGLF